MFASHNTTARSVFITATIAALAIAFSSNLHAQSPLTMQSSTGFVCLGKTGPSAALETNSLVVQLT